MDLSVFQELGKELKSFHLEMARFAPYFEARFGDPLRGQPTKYPGLSKIREVFECAKRVANFDGGAPDRFSSGKKFVSEVPTAQICDVLASGIGACIDSSSSYKHIDLILMPDVVRCYRKAANRTKHISTRVSKLIEGCSEIRRHAGLPKAQVCFALTTRTPVGAEFSYAEVLRDYGVLVLELEADWMSIGGFESDHPGYVSQSVAGFAAYVLGRIRGGDQSSTGGSCLLVGNDFQLANAITRLDALGDSVALVYPEEQIDQRWLRFFNLRGHTDKWSGTKPSSVRLKFYSITPDFETVLHEGVPLDKPKVKSHPLDCIEDPPGGAASIKTVKNFLRLVFSRGKSVKKTTIADEVDVFLREQDDPGSESDACDLIRDIGRVAQRLNDSVAHAQILAKELFHKEKYRFRADKSFSRKPSSNLDPVVKNVVVWPDLQVVRKRMGLDKIPFELLVENCDVARSAIRMRQGASTAIFAGVDDERRNAITEIVGRLGYAVFPSIFGLLSVADPMLRYQGFTPQRFSSGVAYWLGEMRARGGRGSSIVLVAADFQLAAPVVDLVQSGCEILIAFPRAYLDHRWFDWFDIDDVKLGVVTRSRKRVPRTITLRFWDLTTPLAGLQDDSDSKDSW